MTQPFSNLADIIDFKTHPIADQTTPAFDSYVNDVRKQLSDDGCCVLPGFVRQTAWSTLRAESQSVESHAYRQIETVNAYNIGLKNNLPDDHPAQIQFERGNAFVARDQIPQSALVQKLYTSEVFKSFIAKCFGVPIVHEMEDPFAGLVINVLDPEKSHPWHFDTNNFTVSLLTQAADAGGAFEYCPNIRTKHDECLSAVRDVLTGRDQSRIKTLNLKIGDLQIFKGRYALHRVAPVKGQAARHTAIFAYCNQAGVMSSITRTKQLFGRISASHVAHEALKTRTDALLD